MLLESSHELVSLQENCTKDGLHATNGFASMDAWGEVAACMTGRCSGCMQHGESVDGDDAVTYACCGAAASAPSAEWGVC